MGTTKLKKIMRMVEHALTAASFAEEGEFEMAHTLMKESRRVLLGLKQGRIDPRTLKYAFNTAKRIDAHLDILYVVSSTAGNMIDNEPALDSYLSLIEKNGITYGLVTRSGCLKKQIIDYTNSEKGILFAVIDSPENPDGDCGKRDKELSELWRQMKCPLVVVMDGAGA
jgi:K+-sensing histidine kinase KdpD